MGWVSAGGERCSSSGSLEAQGCRHHFQSPAALEEQTPPSPAHPCTPHAEAWEELGGASGGGGREQPGTPPTPPHRGRSLAGRGDRDQVIIYAPPPMLYSFLNSAPATINVVNAEIISIFWRQAVIYSSHFSGGGSHAVKSSALPIKC